VAKFNRHPEELYPRVGLILTSLGAIASATIPWNGAANALPLASTVRLARFRSTRSCPAADGKLSMKIPVVHIALALRNKVDF
jgi:hypothetical protein